MIEFDELSDYLDDYEEYVEPLEFPFLEPNSVDGCPTPFEDIEWYAGVEVGFAKQRLRFVRTADVNGLKVWLWEDSGSVQRKTFIDVSMLGEVTLLSSESGGNWLTPEKYLAYRYASDIAWFLKRQ